MSGYHKTESEIEALVSSFESCAVAEFSHRDHLTVAVWYIHNSTYERAIDKMRTGLFRFLDHHGVGREKYNETLTLFWMKMVHDALDRLESQSKANPSLVVKTDHVLAALSDPKLVNRYYSQERLWSASARGAYLGPDLI